MPSLRSPRSAACPRGVKESGSAFLVFAVVRNASSGGPRCRVEFRVVQSVVLGSTHGHQVPRAKPGWPTYLGSRRAGGSRWRGRARRLRSRCTVCGSCHTCCRSGCRRSRRRVAPRGRCRVHGKSLVRALVSSVCPCPLYSAPSRALGLLAGVVYSVHRLKLPGTIGCAGCTGWG